MRIRRTDKAYIQGVRTASNGCKHYLRRVAQTSSPRVAIPRVEVAMHEHHGKAATVQGAPVRAPRQLPSVAEEHRHGRHHRCASYPIYCSVVRRRRAFKLPEREHTQGRAGAHGQRRWCQEHVARGCSTLSAGSRRCSTERNRGYAHAFLCTARKLSCRRACAPLHAQALTSALHRPPPAAVPVPCWHCYQGMSSWESVCMGHPADVAAGPRGCPVGVGFHPSFDPPYPGYDVDYPQNPKPQSA